MICEICYKTSNDDKRLGNLVMLTIFQDKAMCYRCVAETKAAQKVSA